ncbi:MAG: lipid-A-disaccharide synthase [Nitrospinae bacterium]|nr:lipid-A-disaccharide synthase [Nitrospinota bacterium]
MRILIVAGEASGDLHGSHLVKSFLKIRPDIEICGVGGEGMKEAGVEILFDAKDMGVVGGTEIIGKIGLFWNVYKRLSSEIKSDNYGAIILIDYPTLNLRLAKIAKKRGIPVFYYISPQIWAWRRGRLKKIRRFVDKMLVILPFEEAIYKKAGMDVEYVGHPFIDIVKPTMSKEEGYKRFGIEPNKKVIGLLPGSRKNEIDSLLLTMVSAAKIIKSRIPHIQFILPVAYTIDKDYIVSKIKGDSLDIKIVEGYTYDVMNISDFLILASGSATLEAGLFGVPMVIVYKVNLLTYILGRILVMVRDKGLVNIVAGQRVVPELFQHKATPERIASSAITAIEDEGYYRFVKENLLVIRNSLGKGGASERAALSILRSLGSE